MRKIVFATRNRGKEKEIQAMLADIGIAVQSLDHYAGLPDIVEDGSSFLENALKKARTIAQMTGELCLADDSGLEVNSLHGAPGILSARYAGDAADDEQNIRKLLEDMKGIPPAARTAVFRCVLVLCVPDGSCQAFDGRWEGQIAEAPKGEGGFGYDPVFFLPERGVTVAELPSAVKNTISHRAEAVAKLKVWLQNDNHQDGA